MSAISLVRKYWHFLAKTWAESGKFETALVDAFGAEIAGSQISRLREILLNTGHKDFPLIAGLHPTYLKNHLAAYASGVNTIYIDTDLYALPGLAKSVFAHELGHWADQQLNRSGSEHALIQVFQRSLTGQTHQMGEEADHTDQHGKAEKDMTLPDGRRVKARFFDTPIHINWIEEQLPFLSIDAAATIAKGQSDADAFFGKNLSIGPVNLSPYGLQTHAPSHFDNNNITGGMTAIRNRWLDGISNFNSNFVQPITSDQFLDINNIDALANPAFAGANAGIGLLLYRFGQIVHAFEDFYSHSNWVESVRAGLIDSSQLLDGGVSVPSVIQPGEKIPSTSVVVAQSGPNWQSLLQKSGTGSYTVQNSVFPVNVDIYWNVDSRNPSDGGGVLTAKTLDGRIIHGLATGATNGAVYKDHDFSVFLRDPTKTGLFEKEYFRGFNHGGIARTLYGQWVGPLAKDNASSPGFLDAKKLANLQIQNEWDRMGNLIYANYGVDGLTRFAEYAVATQQDRDRYISTFSTPGSRIFAVPQKLNLGVAFPSRAGALQSRRSQVDAINANEVRLVRLFGESTLASSDPFAAYRNAYQFLDGKTRKWIDSDFSEFTIHHNLSAQEMRELITPSSIQHTAKGERALWSLASNSSVDDAATDYFVELTNSHVPIYIDSFDLAQDRVVFIDVDGNELRLPEELYDLVNISELIAKLSEYGITIDLTPEVGLNPRGILIDRVDATTAIKIEAEALATDPAGQDIFITNYDGSIPFLRLSGGRLEASSIDPVQLNKSYTAYVDISDGVSISRDVPLRLGLIPQLQINETQIESGASFAIEYTRSTKKGYSIFAELASRDALGGLNSFVHVGTKIGSRNGAPAGYNNINSIVSIGDGVDGGAINFWIQNGSSTARRLETYSQSDGGFVLKDKRGKICSLRPLSYQPSTPSISEISYSSKLSNGDGIYLNQTLGNLTPRDERGAWNLSLEMSLYGKDAKNNTIGLALFDSVIGKIVDPSTGLSVNTKAPWYKDAQKYAVWQGSVRNGRNRSIQAALRLDGRVDPDSLVLMPFMKTRGNGRASFYASFDNINPDGGNHIAKLGRNTFGFDAGSTSNPHDLDDVILAVNSMSLS